MLSKNKIKFILSLADKKSRLESGSFLVEGEKMVPELIRSGWDIKTIVVTTAFKDHPDLNKLSSETEILIASENEIVRISTQKSPQGMIAIASIPENYYSEEISYPTDMHIALHEIQDPGNLGTIIRTADWFNVKHIVCNKQTVDVFNPKVIQSTMGAIFRVKVIYTDLFSYVSGYREKFEQKAVVATILEGSNLYKTRLDQTGILMMGNESKGLSRELISLATHKVSIPRFGTTTQQTESLNVSVATAVFISEIKKNAIL